MAGIDNRRFWHLLLWVVIISLMTTAFYPLDSTLSMRSPMDNYYSGIQDAERIQLFRQILNSFPEFEQDMDQFPSMARATADSIDKLAETRPALDVIEQIQTITVPGRGNGWDILMDTMEGASPGSGSALEALPNQLDQVLGYQERINYPPNLQQVSSSSRSFRSRLTEYYLGRLDNAVLTVEQDLKQYAENVDALISSLNIFSSSLSKAQKGLQRVGNLYSIPYLGDAVRGLYSAIEEIRRRTDETRQSAQDLTARAHGIASVFDYMISGLLPPSDPDLPPWDDNPPPPWDDNPPPGGEKNRNRVDGAFMVYVTAGDFQMGSNSGEKNEKPVHTVYLDAYWIYQTEVTNDMFSQFSTATGYVSDAEKSNRAYVFDESKKNWELIGSANWRYPRSTAEYGIEGLGSYPVVQMTWSDASSYCGWAGGRLPTEAEWEKAARGTDGRKYPWGNENINGTLANYADLSINVTWADKYIDDGYRYSSPVGSFPAGASPYGALDMAGNVWEWTSDYSGDYPADVQRNPTGPETGKNRIVRGGSWGFQPYFERTTFRRPYGPLVPADFQGFRCVHAGYR